MIIFYSSYTFMESIRIRDIDPHIDKKKQTQILENSIVSKLSEISFGYYSQKTNELAQLIEENNCDSEKWHKVFLNFDDTIIRIIHNIDMKNLCIAGGAVLELLGITTESSDIDIFEYGNPTNRFEKFIEALSKIFTIKIHFSYDDITNIYIESGETIRKIQYIKSGFKKYLDEKGCYHCDEHVKFNTPEEVVNSFDEDFCKVYIDDGKFYTLKSCVDNIKYKYTYIPKYINGEINMDMYFNKRMRKYLARGFCFKLNEGNVIKDNKFYLSYPNETSLNSYLTFLHIYYPGVQHTEDEENIMFYKSLGEHYKIMESNMLDKLIINHIKASEKISLLILERYLTLLTEQYATYMPIDKSKISIKYFESYDDNPNNISDDAWDKQ